MPIFTTTQITGSPEITGVTVRKAIIEALNERHSNTHENSGAPLALLNEVLTDLGLPTVVERVTVTASVKVRQQWDGEVEIDLADHEDVIIDAAENELTGENVEDLEVDNVGSYYVNVSADLTGRVRKQVTVTLEAGDDLADGITDEIDLEDNWEADGDAEIDQIDEREFV